MFGTASLYAPQGRMLLLATALSFIALEYLLGRLAGRNIYNLRESAATLFVAIGHALTRVAEAAVSSLPFLFVYQHRLFTFDATAPLALGGLFIGSEFLYYWQHRSAHRIRWFWATHSVHHTPTIFNLSAALRLGWTAAVSGQALFFLPLCWLGFPPPAVVGMLAVNLIYQFFIHTELAPRLVGPLEYLLNTPAHHRVHHACNETCLDKNYGGILILFDRLFGSFAEAPREERLVYGLIGKRPSLNPLRIALGEWASMLRDVGRARNWAERIATLVSPPL